MALATRATLRSACKATTRAQRPVIGLGVSGRVAFVRQPTVAVRLFGGGGSGNNEGDKKFLSREEEPEEYWSSKGERAGSNPLSDPLAIIGILAIFFPFVLLLLAVAAGYIDLSVYK